MEYQNKVAAITGAASGIGRELAMQLADKGVKHFALADMRGEVLHKTAEELRAKGVEVVSAVFNVSSSEDFEAFSRVVFSRFGHCDFFFNNAGVSPNHVMWETPMKEWEWVYDVNVMGIVRGINAFVPKMIDSGVECYVFNTSSLAGLACFWGGGAYISSKHAVLGLTEVLELDLRKFNTKVKAYAICPGFVKSNLWQSNTYRPEGPDWAPDGPSYQGPGYEEIAIRNKASGGWSLDTDLAVKRILEEFEADEFILLTDDTTGPRCLDRYKRYLTDNLRPLYVQPAYVSELMKKVQEDG